MRAQDWHKSSYSGNQGACVEVAEGKITRVRDTQHRESGEVAIPSSEWTALLDAVRTK